MHTSGSTVSKMWSLGESTDAGISLSATLQVGRRAVLVLVGRGDNPATAACEGRLIPIEDQLLVGRGVQRPGADRSPRQLLLPDRLVSGRHCAIEAHEGGHVLKDLGSTNGSIVDGRVVRDQTLLHDGSVVVLGQHTFVHRLISAAEGLALEEEQAAPLGPVPTMNPALAVICAKLRKLATSDAEILLLGETGVGKEVHARAIHAASGRSGTFTAIDCAAIPAELLESELFGYEKGAHSTADRAKAGLIEGAEGGTLFLDELGEMPQLLQTKLLRFLQTREYQPLGSSRKRRLDVRIVAATNRPIDDVGQTAMRDDLVARLGAGAVTLPPLRDRPEDLLTLVAHFMGAAARPLSQIAWKGICLYDWPRNVRELEKTIRNALVLAGDRTIEIDHLPQAITAALAGCFAKRGRPGAGPTPTKGQLETLLSQHEGNVSRVSHALGRHSASVWRWLKLYGLEPGQFRRVDTAARQQRAPREASH